MTGMSRREVRPVRDYAPTESLWSRLKVGRLYGRRFATRREAMGEVMAWLNFYNHKQLYGSQFAIVRLPMKSHW